MQEPTPTLNDAARRHTTPTGAGNLVWREWGEGPPLVLLHGGTGSWRHWAANIADLAKTNRVLAPDTPGLGDSDLPPPPATPASIGGQIADGIDALLGNAEYDICGFSYGAMLAAVVAARHGARARTLTLVGPSALGLPRAGVVLEKVRSRTGQDRIEAHRVNLGRFMLAHPSRIDSTALLIQDWNTTNARFKSKDFAHSTVLADSIMVYPGPVHVIWGEADVTASPSLGVRIAAVRIARPDSRISVIPNAGHWVAYDAPDEFTALLRSGIQA